MNPSCFAGIWLKVVPITKSGSFLKYKGEVLAQGRDAAKQVLEENKKLAKEIKAAVYKKIEENRKPKSKKDKKTKEKEDSS